MNSITYPETPLEVRPPTCEAVVVCLELFEIEDTWAAEQGWWHFEDLDGVTPVDVNEDREYWVQLSSLFATIADTDWPEDLLPLQRTLRILQMVDIDDVIIVAF